MRVPAKNCEHRVAKFIYCRDRPCSGSHERKPQKGVRGIRRAGSAIDIADRGVSSSRAPTRARFIRRSAATNCGDLSLFESPIAARVNIGANEATRFDNAAGTRYVADAGASLKALSYYNIPPRFPGKTGNRISEASRARGYTQAAHPSLTP